MILTLLIAIIVMAVLYFKKRIGDHMKTVWRAKFIKEEPSIKEEPIIKEEPSVESL